MRFLSSRDRVELDLEPHEAQAFLDILNEARPNGVGGCYQLEATDENWALIEKMEAWNLGITVEELRQHEDYVPRDVEGCTGAFDTNDFFVYGYFQDRLQKALHKFWEDQNERKAERVKYEAEEKRLNEEGLVKPRFSNGSEFESWCSKNCNRCVKSFDNNGDTFKCELEERGLGGWLAGEPIPLDLAERLGYEEGEIWMGDCTEREPTPMPLILITGSRRVTDTKQVQSALGVVTRRIHPGWGAWELAHGNCPGVDHTARDLFESEPGKRQGYKTTPFTADWNKHGKAAGPIRNGEMVEYALARETALGEPPVCVVAIPDRESRGTWDCVRQAADAGLPVLVIPYLEEA